MLCVFCNKAKKTEKALCLVKAWGQLYPHGRHANSLWRLHLSQVTLHAQRSQVRGQAQEAPPQHGEAGPESWELLCPHRREAVWDAGIQGLAVLPGPSGHGRGCDCGWGQRFPTAGLRVPVLRVWVARP